MGHKVGMVSSRRLGEEKVGIARSWHTWELALNLVSWVFRIYLMKGGALIRYGRLPCSQKVLVLAGI